MTNTDPLGRFASTEATDYPRAAHPAGIYAWVLQRSAEMLRYRPLAEVTMLADAYPAGLIYTTGEAARNAALGEAARRELARRGEGESAKLSGTTEETRPGGAVNTNPAAEHRT